jgi:hypothetical protein
MKNKCALKAKRNKASQLLAGLPRFFTQNTLSDAVCVVGSRDEMV